MIIAVSACAALPPGVTPAPRGDAAAGTLTLPTERQVAVLPGQLAYTGQAHFRWPDGRTYDGSWVNGEPHGAGTETLPDGSRYRGEWRQGERHGEGSLTRADGVYRGGWAHGSRHGEGTFRGSDGSRYDGHWRQGQRSGYGRYVTAAGATYEGDWARDQPHGFGRLETADGASYEGQWRAGVRHGYGRAEEVSGLVYEGTWADDERHGFGRERRPDGSSYVGDWQAGNAHGQGREDRPDGSFHDGSWELNQPLGPGRRHTASGIEISGMWNRDMVSTGLLSLPTGPEYAGPLFSERNRVASERLQTWLSSAAERGDPYAQLLLGTLYLDFDDPPADKAAARRWLRPAADAGIAEAQYRLALTYQGANPPRMVERLSEAAQQQHPEANRVLGGLYQDGAIVPRNLQRSVHYYERAVAAGSVAARNDLAWLLATTGQTSLRDGRRAVDLIRPIALYSGAWQYLDTLAAAWAAAGTFDKAVAAARQAIGTVRREFGEDAAQILTPLRRRLAAYEAQRMHVEAQP